MNANVFKKITTTGAPADPAAEDFPIVLQENAGLMWSAAPVGGKKLTGVESDALVPTLDLGGFTDWREPTVEELFLLHDRSRHSPAIDTDFFQQPPGWYRTSSECAWSRSFVWFVGSDYGGPLDVPRGNSAWLRVVRSVSSAPASSQ